MTENRTEETAKVKLMKKIQKLIDLADGSDYSAESETAMRMAGKLIAKYEINREELGNHENIVQQNYMTGKKSINTSERGLLSLLGIYTGVYILTSAKRAWKIKKDKYGYLKKTYAKVESYYILVGKQEDIDSCLYLYHSILPQIVFKTNEWYKTQKATRQSWSVSKTDKTDYMKGMVAGVNYNLDKINDSVLKYRKSMDMVVVNPNKENRADAENWFLKNNKVRNVSTYVRTGTQAYSSGHKDSDSIKLRKAVSSNEKMGLITA